MYNTMLTYLCLAMFSRKICLLQAEFFDTILMATRPAVACRVHQKMAIAAGERGILANLCLRQNMF